MDEPRGTIFYDCLKVIKYKKPTIFILENVKGLLSHYKGNTFEVIITCLNKLKYYNVYHKVLNTKDYGIPQNRERIFIVGIRKDKMKKEFTFPKKKKMKKIESYIDQTVIKKDKPYDFCKEKLKKSKGVFVDLTFVNITSLTSYQNYCPTLNTYSGLWCVPKHRYASVKEHLILQGFPKKFKQTVSDNQIKKQIGNSMSVNVLVELFKCIFDSIK